jgi:hypothetical protein
MANLFTSQTPALPDVVEGVNVTVAITIIPAVSGTVSEILFYGPATVSGTFEGRMWEATAADGASSPGSGAGTLLGNATFGTITGGVWNRVTLSPAVAVTAGKAYRVGVATSVGRYAATGAGLNSAGITNGDLTAYQNLTTPNPPNLGQLFNGSFIDGSLTAYPSKMFNGNLYFVDVEFTASGTTVSAAVSYGAAPTLSVAATLVQPAAVAYGAGPIMTAAGTRVQLPSVSYGAAPTLTAAGWAQRFVSIAYAAAPTLIATAQTGPIVPYSTATLTPGSSAAATLAPGTAAAAALPPGAAAAATLIAGNL